MRFAIVALLALPFLASAQTFEGRPAVALSNDRVEVMVLPLGSTIASVTLRGDAEGTNPLWNPGRPGSGFGHFLCLDGFGSPSPEEAKAGLPGHGEAVRLPFTVDENKAGKLTLIATLPVAQERLTRTYSVVNGEPVLYVRSRLDSLIGIDRTLVWAEHATVGSPFLEAGITAVDISGSRSQTRPYTEPRQHRLASAKDFTWPMAPLASGGTVDLRVPPSPPQSGDHSTTLMDQSQKWSFATAIHPKRRLMVAWVWPSQDFPWLQNWEAYSEKGMARGLEFSTQPYDISRRDAVAMHRLFEVPTFRWLPAKSTVETMFALVYTRVPEGFNRVARIRVENGSLAFVSPEGAEVKVPASELR